MNARPVTAAVHARSGDPIQAAVDALRRGRPVLVTDDHDRENEGDVILAASELTTDWTAWTVRNTSGLLCAPMTAARADALDLPPMVSNNQDSRRTAYTVTVDAKAGVGTGISAADRTTTVRLLADGTATAQSFVRPGHVLPLRAAANGVLDRPGHTEAAVDLCSAAGLPAVGLIAELVADDGSMMRAPQILDLGSRLQLPVLTIAELIRFRRQQPLPAATLVEPGRARVLRTAETCMPTAFGDFRAIGYRDNLTGAEHVALVSGRPGPGCVVRVHSECLTGEAFGSQRCECGPQLNMALSRVATDGGVVLYLRGHEGRGIGLLKKLAAYRLQDGGLDTVQANLELNEPADGREYGAAAAILHDLGLTAVRLLTNNPDKVAGLEADGIAVLRRLPLVVGSTPTTVHYLRAKRERMGHHLPLRELC